FFNSAPYGEALPKMPPLPKGRFAFVDEEIKDLALLVDVGGVTLNELRRHAKLPALPGEIGNRLVVPPAKQRLDPFLPAPAPAVEADDAPLAEQPWRTARELADRFSRAWTGASATSTPSPTTSES